MGCFASKPAPATSQPSPRQPSPPTGVPQQTQYRGENTEHRRGYQASSPPVPPSQRPDPTPEPVTPVHRPDESIPDPPQSDRKPSQKPRSSRPNYPPVSPGMSRAASEKPFDNARGGWPISEGETSQKPLPEPGSSNRSSHLRPISRAASMDTHNARYGTPRAPPSSFGRSGHADTDSRARPRADPKRAATTLATTGNNTRSLLPTVREVLPEGFRYALRP